MKLRCTADSIRLRVRKSDLELLQSQGEVSTPIHFAPGIQLDYVLQLGSVPAPQASYTPAQIKIVLPKDQALEWIASDSVGIEHQQEYDKGQCLHLLIEKDFPCRHTEETDLQDTFYELAPKDDLSC